MNESGKKDDVAASPKASLALESQAKRFYGLFDSLSSDIQVEVSSFLSLSDLAHLWSAKRLDADYPAEYVLIEYYEREFAPLPWKKFNRPKDVIRAKIQAVTSVSRPLKAWLQNKNFERAKAGLRHAVGRRLTSMVRQMLHQLIPGLIQEDVIRKLGSAGSRLSEAERRTLYIDVLTKSSEHNFPQYVESLKKAFTDVPSLVDWLLEKTALQSTEAAHRVFYTHLFSTPGPDLLEYEEGLAQAFIDMPELVNWLFKQDFNTALSIISRFDLGYEKSNPIFRFDALVKNVFSTYFGVEDPYGAEGKFSALMRTTFIYVLRSKHRPTIDYFLNFPNKSRFSEVMTSIFNNPLERYYFLEALIDLEPSDLRDKFLKYLPEASRRALLTPAVMFNLNDYISQRTQEQRSAYFEGSIRIAELTAKPLQAAVRNLDWKSLQWLLSHYLKEDREKILDLYQDAGGDILSNALLNNFSLYSCSQFLDKLRRTFFPKFETVPELIRSLGCYSIARSLLLMGDLEKLQYIETCFSGELEKKYESILTLIALFGFRSNRCLEMMDFIIQKIRGAHGRRLGENEDSSGADKDPVPYRGFDDEFFLEAGKASVVEVLDYLLAYCDDVAQKELLVKLFQQNYSDSSREFCWTKLGKTLGPEGSFYLAPFYRKLEAIDNLIDPMQDFGGQSYGRPKEGSSIHFSVLTIDNFVSNSDSAIAFFPAVEMCYLLSLHSNPVASLSVLDSHGQSALHMMFQKVYDDRIYKYVLALHDILDAVPEGDRVKVLQIANRSGQRFIDYLCDHLPYCLPLSDVFKVIKRLFLQVATEDRGTLFDLISWKKIMEDRLFCPRSAIDGQVLTEIMCLLPPERRAKFFLATMNYDGVRSNSCILVILVSDLTVSELGQFVSDLLSKAPNNERANLVKRISWKTIWFNLGQKENGLTLQSIQTMIGWIPEKDRISAFTQSGCMQHALRHMDMPTFRGFLNLFPKSDRWNLLRHYDLDLDKVVEIAKDFDFLKPDVSDAKNWFRFSSRLISLFGDFSRGLRDYNDFNSTLSDARSSILSVLEKTLDILNSVRVSYQHSSFDVALLDELIRSCEKARSQPVIRAHRGFFWFQRLGRTYTADRIDDFIREFSAIRADMDPAYSVSVPGIS